MKKLRIPKVSRTMLWTRGALYVGIAVLQKLYEILTSNAPINWPVTIVALLIAAGLTLRVFLDESVANHKQDQADSAPPDVHAPDEPKLAAYAPITGDSTPA